MNNYQKKACSTDLYPEKLDGLLCVALGLASEAGEVAGAVRRILRDDKGVITPDRLKMLSKELGDVLWYVAVLSERLGLKMEDVAKGNIQKLEDRNKRGKIRGKGDNR